MNNRLESFLHALPVNYCGWNAQGVQAISPECCSLLGIDKIDYVEDIGEALSPSDAAALETMWERLRDRGDGFDLIVKSADTKRSFQLTGRRGAVAGGDEIFDVIWFRDVTDIDRSAKEMKSEVQEATDREEAFKSTLDALPMPVWMRNDQLEVSWCNKAYAKALNTTTATVIAEKKELPTTPIDKKNKHIKGSRLLAQQALQKNAKQSEDMHLVFDGDRRRVRVSETPIADMGIVGSCVDITQVEELESEMKHFMASHNEVLEHLRTAIAIYGADTRLEFFNLAYEQLWGLENKWLNKQPKITEILDKLRETRRLPEQADFKQFKSEIVSRFTSLMGAHEEMLYLPDETVLRMVMLPRPRGGLIISFEDVTSRLELESSYNILVDVQQETLDNLSEGVVVFGEDGRLKLWNPTYAALWDFGTEDLIDGVHISELMEKAKAFFDEDDWETKKAELVQNGLARTQTRGRISRADGSVLEYSVVPLPDGNVLNAYFDMTDTVKVEEALREKNAALEEAEQVKLDFLANVSYQLRTPLNAIVGFAEILEQQYFGTLNEKQLGYTAGMLEAGHKLVTLIDDILDLSTIEAGYLTLNKEDINVADVLGGVVDLTAEWARKQDIEIKLSCPKNTGVIQADPQRLKQVMLNLIQNAIRYTDDGGEIKITAKRGDKMLRLEVEDNGVGIAEEELDRIFKPFEKVQGDPQSRDGAGLGLSLVKNIVDLHEGLIDIESTQGKGTKVICHFPL